MRYWETDSFKALQQDWYQRLKDEGFADAEELVGADMLLKQNAEHVLARVDNIRKDARESYYQQLRRKASVEVFDSDIDRTILTMLAEGARIRTIIDALNCMGIRRPPRYQSEFRRCRESIRLTVRKYEIRWGLRQETA